MWNDFNPFGLVQVLAMSEGPVEHAQLLEEIRCLVVSILSDRGLEKPEEYCETILIRDGFYCGRCFTAGGWRLIWLVGTRGLQVQAPDGQTCTAPLPPADLTKETSSEAA